MNKEELKKLLNIHNDQTIRSYLKNGLIPYDLDEEGDAIFDRHQVFKVLGLKNDTDEPFIGSEEAAKIFGVDVKSLGSFLKSRKIPFYVLKNEKGMQRYFLRSEIDAALDFTARWSNDFPDYVARTYFLAETMKMVFNPDLIKGLSDIEYGILDEIIFKRKTLNQVSQDMSLTHERVRQKFQVAIKRVNFQVQNLKGRIANAMTIDMANDKMKDENTKLKIENKILLSKLSEEIKYSDENHEKNIDAYMIRITNFELSVRCRRALGEMEVETLGQLTEMTREDISKYRNVGEKTIMEIEQLLSQNGLSWKDKKVIPVMGPKKSLSEQEIIS